MIKFGIRSYIIKPEPYTTSDRIVAYYEDNKEIPYDTDMSSYIGQNVKMFFFNELGQETMRCIAKLNKIEKKRDTFLDMDTWVLGVSVYENTKIEMIKFDR